MALSTRKKNQIIADWKTGKFSSYYAVAKHYKISQPKAKEILVGIPHSNADIVEVGVVYEKAKKISKNLVEQKAIENAVKERTIADEIEGIIFDGTLDNMKGTAEDVKRKDIELSDRKIAQETFDKGLITVGKAARHAPKTEITNTNATQNNTKRVTIARRSDRRDD